MVPIETAALKIIDRLFDCQTVAAMNNTDLAEYYLSELEWQIVEDYLRIPGQRRAKLKPGSIGFLCGTPIVIQESVMKPTAQQLKDPKWWDKKAPEGATHINNQGIFHKKVLKKMFSYIPIGTTLYWLETGPVPLNELTERPEPSREWRGMQDGLPPEGTECEIYFKSNDTSVCKKAVITYQGDGVGCYRNTLNGKEYTISHHEHGFRPVQSERERLIDDLSREIGFIDSGMITERELAVSMVKKGWGKMMSRAEVIEMLMNMKSSIDPVIPFMDVDHANKIADALGFKE